jgi:hypothetical protein
MLSFKKSHPSYKPSSTAPYFGSLLQSLASLLPVLQVLETLYTSICICRLYINHPTYGLHWAQARHMHIQHYYIWYLFLIDFPFTARHSHRLQYGGVGFASGRFHFMMCFGKAILSIIFGYYVAWFENDSLFIVLFLIRAAFVPAKNLLILLYQKDH